MNKKGLGRGLGSLFSDFDEEEQLEKTTTSANIELDKDIMADAREIPITLIDNNPNQPRKAFDEKLLNELAQSIKNHGVIQPIVLVKRNNRYVIVSGERRWRASKIAGLKTIPALVRRYTDSEIAEIALIENLQREDLNPIESAKAIKDLIENFNLTQENVADRIGKSRSAVTNTLRLLSLEKEVVKLIEDGRLSAGHGKILVSVAEPSVQIELANLCCDNKVSVRELEKYIKQYQNPKEPKVKEAQSLELKNFTNVLKQKLSTKVSILGNDNKGRIFIDYYSKEDLNRIYEILNK